jgi:GntR family transcriptional regulator/MocR family aminotransferase
MVRRGGKTPVPFRLGVPALDAFPTRLWARLTARRWRSGGFYLGDGEPAGQPELRAAIAEYVANARGACCTADQVIVVGGIQHGVDLIARVLLDPGDPVWVEDPGYVPAHAVLRAAGARLVPVPVDDEGLDIAAGERAAPAARLAHVTPSHQFPLGAVLSAPRRLALLDWARRADAWVVEDDYDSEFRYAGRPLPCLQGMETMQLSPREAAHVLYLGTFSKTLVPGLRLGYLIVPEALIEPIRAARGATDWHAPTPQQSVLADFIGEGHYARHLRRVRALYAERQAVLIAAAEAELADHLSLAPGQAGLHLVGWLPHGVDDQQAAAAAAAAGVLVYPISNYRVTSTPEMARAGLLLGYAGFDDAALQTGIGKLRRALETLPS